MRGVLLLLLSLGCQALAAPRILYLTHSAGYRHDSIPVSVEVLRRLAERSGAFEIVHTEETWGVNAENLRNFDAVLFFTSGELPLDAEQKQALLDFVRSGKGFAGVHSATDTLYTWPEYGELIGARFDGHPWAQEVTIQVETPDDPLVAHLAPSFRLSEEIYQFRDFSRDRSRVLLKLDPRSVDLAAPEVRGSNGEFPLAWSHPYGEGRAFYTALGHGDNVWLDERFQEMMVDALLWAAAGPQADFDICWALREAR